MPSLVKIALRDVYQRNVDVILQKTPLFRLFVAQFPSVYPSPQKEVTTTIKLRSKMAICLPFTAHCGGHIRRPIIRDDVLVDPHRRMETVLPYQAIFPVAATQRGPGGGTRRATVHLWLKRGNFFWYLKPCKTEWMK